MPQKTLLPSGLRVITEKLANTQAVTCLVLVGAGSRYESKAINGISHFLEHMFFKGAKKFRDTKAVSEAIDAVGGDFNAFTGKEYAGYYVKVAADHVEIATDVLADMLINSRFAVEEIEKERGVILEEYNMYQDTPMYQIGWDFEQLMYGDQPMGWDQIGTKELITSVTREQFQSYKRELYTPDNTVIALVGNIEHERALALVSNYFAAYEGRRSRESEPLRSLSTPAFGLRNKGTEQGHLVVGVSGPSSTDPDYYPAKVLAVLLGGNMSSRMFLSVREAQGLAYYVSTSLDDYSDSGVFSTRAGVDLKRAEQAVSAIIKEYVAVKEGEIPAAELLKSKEYLKGKMILRLEDSEEYAHLLAKRELLQGAFKTPKEIIAAIDAVELPDLRRVAARIFQPAALKLAVIGPFADREDSFRDQLRFC